MTQEAATMAKSGNFSRDNRSIDQCKSLISIVVACSKPARPFFIRCKWPNRRPRYDKRPQTLRFAAHLIHCHRFVASKPSLLFARERHHAGSTFAVETSISIDRPRKSSSTRIRSLAGNTWVITTSRPRKGPSMI